MKFLRTTHGLVNIDFVIRIEPPTSGARWVHYQCGREVEKAKLLQEVPLSLLIESGDERTEEIDA
jgi:hypothetical protein